MSNRNRGASSRVYVAFSMHIFDFGPVSWPTRIHSRNSSVFKEVEEEEEEEEEEMLLHFLLDWLMSRDNYVWNCVSLGDNGK